MCYKSLLNFNSIVILKIKLIFIGYIDFFLSKLKKKKKKKKKKSENPFGGLGAGMSNFYWALTD
jgi:hypothetical protein